MTAVLTAATVQLTVQGERLPREASATLVSLQVHQHLSRPAQLIATFLVLNRSSQWMPVLGDTIEATVGGRLFSGEIVALEHEWTQTAMATVTLRAHDALDTLRHTRTTQRYEAMTAGQIMTTVFERHGLGVDHSAATGADATVVDVVLQYGETDLAFVQRLATQIGVFFLCAGSTVTLFREHRSEAPLRLGFGRELIKVAIDSGRERDTDRVRISGWHETEKAEVSAGDGAVSAGWLVSPALAPALVDAAARASAWRRTVTTAVTIGDASIVPGRRIELSGEAGEVANAFVVVSATHRFSADEGYMTDFSSDPGPSAGPTSPQPATFTVGRVVDLADPENRGRIRVSLIAYSGIETSWLAVVGPGVGADRGVVALPDLDDRVIIVGPVDEVGSGVVLGGIATGAALSGPPVDGGANHRLVARLPGGAALTLENDGLMIEDGHGSSLEFRGDHVTLFSATDLEINAPGRALVIRADTIDFERA